MLNERACSILSLRRREQIDEGEGTTRRQKIEKERKSAREIERNRTKRGPVQLHSNWVWVLSMRIWAQRKNKTFFAGFITSSQIVISKCCCYFAIELFTAYTHSDRCGAYFFLLAPTITIILQRHVAIRSIRYLIEVKKKIYNEKTTYCLAVVAIVAAPHMHHIKNSNNSNKTATRTGFRENEYFSIKNSLLNKMI